MAAPFHSRAIMIGDLKLGGDSPVRIQSMASTDTNDIGGSLAQCKRMIDAGAELVRFTTQGSREVESLRMIREKLRLEGYTTPLVADTHFRPSVALEAARITEKIRINPGNYLKKSDPGSSLPELLRVCRENGTAIRIGVNHGSLAGDILEVESAMRFLRVCAREGMEKVVVSMKSSNPRVMIYSVRLLTHRMVSEGMDYPLHLGVTEAGDGIDGRIKSVAGMAPLLLEGLGDTIRVSLTEPPENELPVARMITSMFPRVQSSAGESVPLAWDPFSYRRRKSGFSAAGGIGMGSPVRIVSPLPPDPALDLTPGQIAEAAPLDRWKDFADTGDRGIPVLLEQGDLSPGEVKGRLNGFCLENVSFPVIYRTISGEKDADRYRIQLAGELAALLIDGAIDAVQAENPFFPVSFINEALLSIFQATGTRISKMEYIACPSCGRTHFDLLKRLKEIREATAHLAPLRIGVMGCIVNGPGEMADADYGYVGAGKGLVTLYRGREAVKKNLPEEEALEELIRLIKKEGDWRDPVSPPGADLPQADG
jgi:(E)-4-hydroxy-3-methylbut-2-enyl-diphosphate synthase